jgi:oxalate decarboxylase/phosphoglucose isomerase-like protein (cupin superfamily)
MIIKQNWRDVHPTIAHKSGIDWRLLSMSGNKTDGDIDADVDSKFQCLKSITYVSLAQLQPRLSYESHKHEDHEEIYYIIKGKGRMRIEEDEVKFREGDIIYIPEKKLHTIMNDHDDEMIEFLAFGGLLESKNNQ